MLNDKCTIGLSPSGHCGAAACCAENKKCCAACKKDCNMRCGWIKDKQEEAHDKND